MQVSKLLIRPTAWVPFALSAFALITIAVHIAIAGTTRQADEGTAAHIWQVLIVVQGIFVALFAFLWLPKVPRPAILILALQLVGMAAAMVPAAVFGW